MRVGDKITVRGYVTKLKFIAGRDLQYIERVLGFHAGRFSKGIWAIRLDRLPALSEFEVAGYSMVAEHRFAVPTDLNLNKVKQNARASWTLDGPDSLVKVRPGVDHDIALEPDLQYPPGLGAPQWKLIAQIPATVIAEVARYPAGVFRAV